MPSRLNCGSQKRLRFGSLPTIRSRKLGFAFTIAAVYAANSACASGVSGVVREPAW